MNTTKSIVRPRRAPVTPCRPLDEALWYACGQRWAVVPLWLPQPSWEDHATTEPAVIRGWWTWDPVAPVVLPTGRDFDVLDVPEEAGRAALGRLQRRGVRIGPVAVTDGGRFWFFVQAGAREELPAQLEWLDWAGIALDIHVHGTGDYVLAPRCTGPRTGDGAIWVRPPQGVHSPHAGPSQDLPEVLPMLDALAHAVFATVLAPARDHAGATA